MALFRNVAALRRSVRSESSSPKPAQQLRLSLKSVNAAHDISFRFAVPTPSTVSIECWDDLAAGDRGSVDLGQPASGLRRFDMTAHRRVSGEVADDGFGFDAEGGRPMRARGEDTALGLPPQVEVFDAL